MQHFNSIVKLVKKKLKNNNNVYHAVQRDHM